MTFNRILTIGGFACLAIYLFVTAPPPLPSQAARALDDRALPVTHLFDAVNAINESARSIYTARVVGGGLKAGLKFGEDWSEPGVEKGPLPALFLRLAASRMEAKPPRLGLYLGSDAPINASNLFKGAQADAYEDLKATAAPVFATTERGDAVAMYPDVASAGPCVTCHNDHPDSPKKDWKLDEIMGATTWTYPADVLSASEYLTVTEALYHSVEEAYQTYLDRAAGFSTPVPVGQDWPAEGQRVLPDLPTFMAEVRRSAGGQVMQALLLTTDKETAQ